MIESYIHVDKWKGSFWLSGSLDCVMLTNDMVERGAKGGVKNDKEN